MKIYVVELYAGNVITNIFTMVTLLHLENSGLSVNFSDSLFFFLEPLTFPRYYFIRVFLSVSWEKYFPSSLTRFLL